MRATHTSCWFAPAGVARTVRTQAIVVPSCESAGSSWSTSGSSNSTVRSAVATSIATSTLRCPRASATPTAAISVEPSGVRAPDTWSSDRPGCGVTSTGFGRNAG